MATTIPVQGSQIKYSDIQKAFGGNNSNSFSTAAIANSLNTLNNYTIAGLNLNNGNISNVQTITATTLNNDSALTLQTTTTNDIIFKTTTNEKMRILVNGNVGIGTTNSTYKLDVNGSINTNEYFIKGNNIHNIFLSLQSIKVTNIRNPINEITNPIVEKIVLNTNYYYYVFTYSGDPNTTSSNYYTITFNYPTYCDILIVGGGGAGHSSLYGTQTSYKSFSGGGGGEVRFHSNMLLNNQQYTLTVGRGAITGTGTQSTFNISTTNILKALGGRGAIRESVNLTPDSGNYRNGSPLGLGFLNGGGGGGANGDGFPSWGKDNYVNYFNITSNGSILNPVAWYKFDNSANIGLDSMGSYNLTNILNTNNVTYNSTSFVKGTGSASFLGKPEIIGVHSFYRIKENSFTINFWQYNNEVDQTTNRSIFSFGEMSTHHKNYFNRRAGGMYYFTMDLSPTDLNELYYTPPSSTYNIWIMITITYNFSTKLVEMYFNGSKVSFKTFSNVITLTDYTFVIGSTYAYTFSEFSFKGLLDDFRIYNVVLTPTQILNLYNDGNPYYYKFGNGGTGVDYSSYFGSNVGHDGWFGGGGGGGGTTQGANFPGIGGKGGGADGIVSDSLVVGNNGLPNTGGGGGGSYRSIDYFGGKGGSGVVILRMLKDETPIYNLNLI